jgi:hypothetical protein
MAKTCKSSSGFLNEIRQKKKKTYRMLLINSQNGNEGRVWLSRWPVRHCYEIGDRPLPVSQLIHTEPGPSPQPSTARMSSTPHVLRSTALGKTLIFPPEHVPMLPFWCASFVSTLQVSDWERGSPSVCQRCLSKIVPQRFLLVVTAKCAGSWEVGTGGD